MCNYIYVYIYYINAHTYTSHGVYIYIYMYIHLCTHIHIHVYVSVCCVFMSYANKYFILTHVLILYISTFSRVSKCNLARAHTHIDIHVWL